MGTNILGREKSIYKGPIAEVSRVRGRQCQIPEGTLSPCSGWNPQHLEECLAQKRHLEKIIAHRPACLNE